MKEKITIGIEEIRCHLVGWNRGGENRTKVLLIATLEWNCPFPKYR